MMKVGTSVEEPLINLTPMDAVARQHRVREVLRDVGLPERLHDAYPWQISGGERQRACIARALAPAPQILICDEPVSALDKSIQGQIIELLKALKVRHGLTCLFISHDLTVVNALCDRVAVMYQGRIVEDGDRNQVLFDPQHDYTRALVDAARYFLETPLWRSG
jgi:ABC-type glutathione transport system ATPase component